MHSRRHATQHQHEDVASTFSTGSSSAISEQQIPADGDDDFMPPSSPCDSKPDVEERRERPVPVASRQARTTSSQQSNHPSISGVRTSNHFDNSQRQPNTAGRSLPQHSSTNSPCFSELSSISSSLFTADSMTMCSSVSPGTNLPAAASIMEDLHADAHAYEDDGQEGRTGAHTTAKEGSGYFLGLEGEGDGEGSDARGPVATTVSRQRYMQRHLYQDDDEDGIWACPLCACVMASAVQMRPCGHSFCASCLSQHLGAQLQGGVPLACPFKCPIAERVVADHAVRSMVKRLHHRSAAGSTKSWSCGSSETGSLLRRSLRGSGNGGTDSHPAASLDPHSRGLGHSSSLRAGRRAAQQCWQQSQEPGEQCAQQQQQRLDGAFPLLQSAADGHGIPHDPNTQYLDMLTKMAASALLEQDKNVRLQQQQHQEAGEKVQQQEQQEQEEEELRRYGGLCSAACSPTHATQPPDQQQQQHPNRHSPTRQLHEQMLQHEQEHQGQALPATVVRRLCQPPSTPHTPTYAPAPLSVEAPCRPGTMFETPADAVVTAPAAPGLVARPLVRRMRRRSVDLSLLGSPANMAAGAARLAAAALSAVIGSPRQTAAAAAAAVDSTPARPELLQQTGGMGMPVWTPDSPMGMPLRSNIRPRLLSFLSPAPAQCAADAAAAAAAASPDAAVAMSAFTVEDGQPAEPRRLRMLGMSPEPWQPQHHARSRLSRDGPQEPHDPQQHQQLVMRHKLIWEGLGVDDEDEQQQGQQHDLMAQHLPGVSMAEQPEPHAEPDAACLLTPDKNRQAAWDFDSHGSPFGCTMQWRTSVAQFSGGSSEESGPLEEPEVVAQGAEVGEACGSSATQCTAAGATSSATSSPAVLFRAADDHSQAESPASVSEVCRHEVSSRVAGVCSYEAADPDAAALHNASTLPDVGPSRDPASASVMASRVGSGGSPAAAAAAEAAGRSSSFKPAAEVSSSLRPKVQLMSLLCPLHDEDLPVEVAAVKTTQVQGVLLLLKEQAAVARAGSSSGQEPCPITCAMALETVARLGWSDDEVREMIAGAGGVRALVDVMKGMSHQPSVQVTACLALMALVRGEGELCQSNQWGVAKAGGVEVITEAMEMYPDSLMVQLAALLCLIPLTLDNSMMQAYLSRRALTTVLSAMCRFPKLAQVTGFWPRMRHWLFPAPAPVGLCTPEEAALQTKGLVLLGVLVEGSEPLQEAVRQRLLEEGVVNRVYSMLLSMGAASDDILWACLFCMAGLSRQPPPGHVPGTLSASRQALRQALRAGLLPLLRTCTASYYQRVLSKGVPPDELIQGAGLYLQDMLEEEEGRRGTEMRKTAYVAIVCATVFAAGVAAFVCFSK